jgi:hypothetical protein
MELSTMELSNREKTLLSEAITHRLTTIDALLQGWKTQTEAVTNDEDRSTTDFLINHYTEERKDFYSLFNRINKIG